MGCKLVWLTSREAKTQSYWIMYVQAVRLKGPGFLTPDLKKRNKEKESNRWDVFVIFKLAWLSISQCNAQKMNTSRCNNINHLCT